MARKQKHGGSRPGAGRPPKKKGKKQPPAKKAAKVAQQRLQSLVMEKAAEALGGKASKPRGRPRLVPQTQSHLSSGEIESIINACILKNVRRLKTADIEIELGPEGPQPITPAPAAPEPGAPSPQTLATADPEALADMQATQLMIDDPVAFEQATIDSMLEEDAQADGRQAQPDLRGG